MTMARYSTICPETDKVCDRRCGLGVVCPKRHDRLVESDARWRKNSRDTFDAMVTMRNDINEYIPMPSLESDLLSGPENSVFCAAVAEAVVTYVRQQNDHIESLRSGVSFGRAFAAARSAGASEFSWRGGRYSTKLAGE